MRSFEALNYPGVQQGMAKKYMETITEIIFLDNLLFE